MKKAQQTVSKMTQLSLFETATHEIKTGWADGDSRPEQLERLACLLRKTKYHPCDWRDKSKWGKCYRMVDVRVEGQEVIVTGELIDVSQIYGGKPPSPPSHENEEEEAA